jgi:HPt (histidine-containing phosphotransfer) domain-containing protein
MNTPVYLCCQPGLLLDAVDGDTGIFLDLAKIFVDETIARHDDIARASAAGAFSEMGFEAHTLKGTVGAVGAAELVRLLQDIEHNGLRLRRACTHEQLSQLGELLQRARDDMHAYVAMLKQSI